jgi:hypothetical protein
MDFAKMYPEKSKLFTQKWLNVRSKIMELVPKKNEALMVMKTKYDQTTDANAKDILAILTLHHLVYSTKIIKKGGKSDSWSTTIANSKESLITYVPSINNMEDTLKKRQSLRAKYGLSPQPIIVSLEENVWEAKSFIIKFDDIYYELASFLQAFDVLFKIFIVFDLQYPLESQNFYCFVQKYFYELSFKKDPKLARVSQVIAELNKMSTDG